MFNKLAITMSTIVLCVANAQAQTSPPTPDAKQVPEKVVAKKWVCEAPNMISFDYSGGAWANIHLSPYSSGGSYQVVKDGSTATGVTANGTKFVCKEV